MSKVIYTAAMSLDGFIAGPGGDMTWMRPFMGPNPEVDALQREIGALLIGNRTFHGDDPNRGTDREGAFSGTWTGPSFVLTHEAEPSPVDGVTFVGDLRSGLAAAREAAGPAYVGVLGADVARQCLEVGQLDEVLMMVVPVLLGGGTRMFERAGGCSVALEPVKVGHAPSGVNLWYRVAGKP